MGIEPNDGDGIQMTGIDRTVLDLGGRRGWDGRHGAGVGTQELGRRRRGVPGFLILWSVTLCLACGDSFTATIEDRRPFVPLPVYADWWRLAQECSGRSGDLPRIDWYLASSIVADGKLARARWSPPHDIVVVQGNQTEERLIRHEMLHDLLGGDSGHEGEVWDVCDLRF